MPLYVYQCPFCKEIFEAIRKIEERRDAIVCPECNAPSTNLLIQPVTLDRNKIG